MATFIGVFRDSGYWHGLGKVVEAESPVAALELLPSADAVVLYGSDPNGDSSAILAEKPRLCDCGSGQYATNCHDNTIWCG